MRIHVRLNGSLVHHFQQDQVSVKLQGQATVTDLLKALAAQQPAADGALRAAVAVVGETHVGRQHPLADQQEVNLHIPLAGG
ncbi:MAG: MoaD/ThiS family protein [Bacillota bacterium]